MLLKFASGITALNTWIGRQVGWLTVALVLLVVIDVFLRKVFFLTANWVAELEWHLYAVVFLLGAAYTLARDRHVRVDLFYDRFSKKDKALVNIIGSLVLLIPWCVILIWAGWQYAWQSWLDQEGSPEPGGLPGRYVIKFILVLGLFLLLLQGIAEVIQSWHRYRQPESARGKEKSA